MTPGETRSETPSENAHGDDATDASPEPRRYELPSLWRRIHEVFRRVDAGIAEVYERIGVTDVRPRYSATLMFLDDGPMTIRRLAYDCGVSHSAMSQTVSAMRSAGLVASVPSPDDARHRLVSLTEKGRAIVPLLRAEWTATEAALAQLEQETPYPLSQLAEELHAALDAKPFADRAMELIERPGERPGEPRNEQSGEQR
ncbi:MarR family winged helix-turn-helix transcriptional regulator [Gryllotalpicola ginsengisoli]|uniref:MarR family winged helix-turn-helix transcriptional regulator n=1 Tax=Gryllotalpicola ginsengisoli TaxID=444608 RepID=UPI00041FCF2E|nr:MarR family winged helix-turn-helix transcriptional regulator [Gryllotalpicola ginsengisoli]